MNTHTQIRIIIFALFISFSLFSQHGRKKIKVLKVSYITEELNLSEQEAESFWPIYNKFEKRKHTLCHGKRISLKEKIEELGGVDNLTEKEAKFFANNMLDLEKERYNIDAACQKELSNVISYKKIVKLQMVERDFNRRLFRRYKDQKKRIHKEN
jgi:hypothetical protein